MSGLHDHNPLRDCTDDESPPEDRDAVAWHVLNWAARTGTDATTAAEVCEMLGIDPRESLRRLQTALQNERTP